MTGTAVIEQTHGIQSSVSRRYLVFFAAAVALAAVFIVAHLLVALLLLPQFQDLYRNIAGVPWPARAVTRFADTGLLPVALVALDIAVFAFFYRLADRRSVGLLFVPAVWYAFVPLVLLLAVYQPLLGRI